jgi:hypothetical protein
MSIYRGTGSASTTTDQATIDEVTTQATNAASSATSAASSASSAASSASSASSSASTATTQASAASTSASSASSSASTATTKANEASSSATNAAASATTASSHATNASTAKDAAVVAQGLAEDAQLAAETAKGLAEGFKDLAATSASSASASASTATTKAGEALASANSASNAQTAAEAAQAAAEAAQAAIDGTYLGAQASNPTGDGNGNDVTVGDWYFNTTANQAYIYNGSTWDALAPDLIGDATPQLGGNLDLNSNDITGTGNINVTGTVTADGLTVDTDTLYVDATNNRVGIGTDNPSDLLELSGSTAQPAIRFTDEDVAGLYHRVFTPTNTGLTISADTGNVAADSFVRFDVDGTEVSRVTSTGIDVTGTITADGLTVDTDTLHVDATNNRVGIGTTSPAASLTVEAGGEPTIRLNKTALGVTADFKIESNKAILRTTTSDPLILKTNNIDRLRASANGDISFYEDTGTTAKFFWDASAESLGIGTSSPDAPLTVQGGSATAATIQLKGGALANDNASIHSLYNLYLKADSSESISGRNIVFQVGSTEGMRIDSSGNLLVGTTDGSGFTTSSTNSGVKISDGIIAVNGAGGSTAAGFFNVFDDGNILDLRKDGATVGSIGTKNSDLFIGTGDTGIRFADSVNSVYPHNTATNEALDATISLGAGGFRFKDLYLSGGVYLGGTGAANHLDDYEEGTWTPTVGVGTVSSGNCTYTKIGRIVHLTFDLQGFSDTSSSATVEISGLPFSSIPSNTYHVGGVYGERVDADFVSISPYIDGNEDNLRFVVGVGITGFGSSLRHQDINDGSDVELRGSITYVI